LPNNRLRVAVVGGGIGGLSAANSLIRRGLDVTLFEQVDTLREVGTGLSLFPNGRRQLERMGLKDALAQVGAKIGDVSVYRMDGSLVGPIPTQSGSVPDPRGRSSPDGDTNSPSLHWVRTECSRSAVDICKRNDRRGRRRYRRGWYPVIPAKVCRPTVDTGIFRLSCVSRFGPEGEGPGMEERGPPNLDGRWQALYGVPCSAW
jgi:hypothetical protein